MSRADLQAADHGCREIPERHLPVQRYQSSGSTGEPVTISRTAVSALDWMANSLREHLWRGRDFRGRLAAISTGAGRPERRADWGSPASLLFATGEALTLPSTMDIPDILDSLIAFNPASLLAYPSLLAALLDEMERTGRRPGALADLRTRSETVPDALREAAARVLGATVADIYSSNEFGHIAIECPVSGLYHLMAESLIVEVLDERGEPCAPGETGSVVVSDLHNFATPMIRYRTGDFAVAGGACSCGRTLPTLARILGRERNLVRLPDGRRNWPAGFYGIRELAPIAQLQLVQTAIDAVEVRFTAERPLTSAETAALGERIHHALGHPFTLSFHRFAGRLPTGPNGKFEEFISLV